MDAASLLTGAGPALAGTVAAQTFLQLVVVPRVERRKRSADRWERDVIALGELLVTEVLPTRNRVATAVHKLGLYQEHRDEGARVSDALLLETEQSIHEAAEELAALVGIRAQWLVVRVREGAKRERDTDALIEAWEAFLIRCRDLRRSEGVRFVQGTEWPEHWLAAVEADRARERELVDRVLALARIR